MRPEPPAGEALPLGRGDAIDRFTVLGPLGMGGMGVVVSAYDCTLDRKVAIKVLRPDRKSVGPEEGRARLMREAQAMARLSHPNVITVYEVGTVGEQVFVAMELIEGETLGRWLRREPRSWREVVRTFVHAGRGLAAAHRAGLVHRDFKPDNVLVGADGEVRVTDFGLAGLSEDARAVTSDVALGASLTRTGTLLGTPAYMSPEQHQREAATARSDQFSFAVALYEALYGTRPFAGESSAEVHRAITAGRLAAAVRDAPRWLRPIVLRALQHRPEDRWPNMDALLAALDRDPAAARRRWLAWIGAGTAVAIAAGAWVTRERPALCQGAVARVVSIWDAAARVRVRAAFLATGSPIAADVFARVDRRLAERLEGWSAAHTDACEATHVRGEQSLAMLDLRMACLERARRGIASLVDVWSGGDAIDLEQAVQAAETIGDTSACADTEALAMPVAPPRDPDVARRIDAVRQKLDAASAHELAGKLAAARALAHGALATATVLAYPPVVAEALHLTGGLECDAGQLETGVGLLYSAARAAAEARDDVLAARILVRLLSHLAEGNGQRLAEAAAVSTLAEAAVARAGRRDELVALLLRAQGRLLAVQGNEADALARFERALSLHERSLRLDHPFVARTLNSIAQMHSHLGRLDEAVRLHRRALAILERTLGPEHPAIVDTLNDLARTLTALGDYDEAERFMLRALAIREKVYPPGHRLIARSLNNLGSLRAQRGRPEQARPLFERAERMLAETLGPAHRDTVTARHNLAMVLIESGERAEGKWLLAEVVESRKRQHGAEHTSVALTLSALGQAYRIDGDWARAEEALAQAVSIWRRQAGDPPDLADVLVELGRVRIGQRRFNDAIALLEEARAIDDRVRGTAALVRADHIAPLGEAYLGAGRVMQAITTLETGLGLVEIMADRADDAAALRFALAQASWAAKARVRAVALAERARDGFSETKGSERARVETWLRTHRP